MNKLLTKIVGISLGLSMAIGVGVAASYSEKDAVKADAAGIPVSIEKSDLGSIYNTNKTVQKTVSSSNDLSIAFSGVNTKSSATAKTDYTYMMFVKNSGYAYSSSCPSGYYPSKVSFTFTSGTGTGGTVGISFGTSSLSSRDSSVTGAVTKSGTCELDNNDKTKLYWNFSTNGANVQVQSISLTYTSTSAGDPTVSSVVVTAGTQTGTYKNDTFIQCSAVVNGDNDPSQVVVWTLSSTNSYVADQTEVNGAAIDTSGKVTFSQDASVYAFATSTVTGYTSVRGSALCSVSGLLDPVDYVKVDKTSRLSAGTKVVILNSALTHALSTTQNTNNRAATEITVDDSGADPIAKVIPTKVQVFTLVTGVESGFNFSFDDGGTTKYLYANGTGSNNYLKSGTSRYANSTDFNISVVSGETSISLVQNSYNGVMQYNSSKLFSCYASATQSAVSIFMEGSSLPGDQNLSSISNIFASNVEVGSTIHVTASYSPTDATENIVVTTSGAGSVTCSEVSMSAGTATFTVTGDSAGSVTITLTGETTTTATANTTISVTSFTATHTKVTSTSSLYNGAKVILGNFDSELVGAAHTGGNNMPTAAGSFSTDGSSLSNSSGNGREYTLWQLTIKDSEENDITGWAFYDNGHYLHCTDSTSNNYLKRTDELTSMCLFTITISDGDTSIVCADTHVSRGTVALNGTIIGAYSSLGSYGAMDLYLKEVSSDTAIAAGYEDFFLMMDVDLSSHGYCTSKHWYDFAKDAYNNTLTTTQKGYLSSDAIARLSAWADANGDTLSGGSLSAKTTTGLLMLGDGATAITIIVIIAAISITSIGALLVLKKRKEQF